MLSSLEAHWHVLEAEVVEISRDIEYCEQCLRKYGEWFNSPLQYLRVPPCHPLPARHGQLSRDGARSFAQPRVRPCRRS